MKNRSCFLILVLSALAALSACAAQTGVPSTDSSSAGEPTDAPEPHVLAELTGPAGQRVVFLEIGPGEVTVQETGALGAPPMLQREWKGLVELYTQLAPIADARVVEVLERADLYAAELDREPPPDWAPEPEAPVQAHGAAEGVSASASALQEVGSHPLLTGAQFRALACNSWDVPPYDGVACATDTTFASSGWPGDTKFIRSFVLHAGGLGVVTHDERKWVCTAVVPIVEECVTWGWRTTSTLTIRPGQYGLFTNAGRRTRYQASCPDTARLHFSAVWDLQ